MVQIALRIFYRKVSIHKAVDLPSTGPLIIMGNHPNTFMDPLIIATLFKQQVGFLGNASIFIHPIINAIFAFFKVIPVYRDKDVAPGEKIDNEKTFRDCYKFLENNGSLMMFPEGTSYHELKLRKIKTGGARIALSAEKRNQFELGVHIMPVGLYYSDPSKFRSKIYVNTGELIAVKDFEEAYHADEVAGVYALTESIKKSLEALTITTEDKEQEALFFKVKRIYKKELIKKLNAGKQEEFELTKEIANAIQYFKVTFPNKYEGIKAQIDRCHQLMDEFRTTASHTAPLRNRLKKHIILALGSLYLLAGFPVYVYGLLQNFLPYRTPYWLSKKFTKEAEYYAPIRMSLGIVVFPIYYFLSTLLFYSFVPSDLILTSCYVVSLPLSGYFVLHYYQFFQSGLSFLKIHNFINRKRDQAKELEQLKRSISTALDEALAIYLKRL
ncbi:1-acyl-sn-glycerol-3-phosphate acyltransferase [Reichenbachiella carrageenanivorans]|uniref:1-acyl-sn-glycerol-3-phosphate acyltransferase n=1 Tax=Reichenbachiella carrageenanivorans TaxID=2979869 RepID=A0ABY6CZT7_9BACT|nr:1-acyl-sn-glycerol-3-phosphate acyltransferase [Reichenbachiella carrageenanivorans]UXX79427.1 1-acyl-sn-glycerol-3-phosphate acyltransferase [Reichenbachiella carrageenanivorans]